MLALLSKTPLSSTKCIATSKRHLSTSVIRSASAGSLPKVPLYIGGRAIESSSGGTITNYHSKTGEKTCEVVVAGEEET